MNHSIKIHPDKNRILTPIQKSTTHHLKFLFAAKAERMQTDPGWLLLQDSL